MLRVACCVLRESNERFQALADDIRVREPDVMGQDFPRRIEKGRRGGGSALRGAGCGVRGAGFGVMTPASHRLTLDFGL